MNFRIYTRIDFSDSQILRGALAATKIRLFLDEFSEILEHCCFIKEYVITGNIRVFDGPIVISENIPFPIDDESIETLDDAVDIIELKKKYPTVSLEFEFTILFSTPNKTPKYRDYIHSIHHSYSLWSSVPVLIQKTHSHPLAIFEELAYRSLSWFHIRLFLCLFYLLFFSFFLCTLKLSILSKR